MTLLEQAKTHGTFLRPCLHEKHMYLMLCDGAHHSRPVFQLNQQNYISKDHPQPFQKAVSISKSFEAIKQEKVSSATL
jgi:hypothetical protein